MTTTTINIALTGHRPDKLDGYSLNTEFYKKMRHQLMSIIVQNLEQYDTVICHTGMALGADTIWAEAIANMKHKFGDRVQFIAHIPCKNQTIKWRKSSVDHYNELMKYADDDVLYSKEYTKNCMQLRNIGMVDRADTLIAIWDGSKGGTENCVRAAIERHVHIEQIKPDTFKN